MISFKWSADSKKMPALLKRIAQKYPDKVAAAQYAEMQIEATEMKRRCPVDTRPNPSYPHQHAPHPGQLRNSIHVERPITRGKTIIVIVATGAQAPYAVFVHEDPDAYHYVGEWQFMASVLNESRSTMNGRIARRIHFDKMKASDF